MCRPRIVIVDRQTLVAEAVKKLIEVELNLDVVILADATVLLKALDKWQPDVILFLIYHSYPAVLECARRIKAAHPPIKIIVVTTNENPTTAVNCVDNWASGYLLMKSADELVKAVRYIAGGSKYLSPELQERFEEIQWRGIRFQSGKPLTARQRQVLELINVGCTMNEIATNLHISARTVAFHKYRMMAKLGAENNFELLRIAVSGRA